MYMDLFTSVERLDEDGVTVGVHYTIDWSILTGPVLSEAWCNDLKGLELFAIVL